MRIIIIDDENKVLDFTCTGMWGNVITKESDIGFYSASAGAFNVQRDVKLTLNGISNLKSYEYANENFKKNVFNNVNKDEQILL